MILLNKKYIFDKTKYSIQQVNQSSILISNELFKVLCVNDTGRRVIEEFNGINTVQDIINKLSKEYAIGESIISEMVQEFTAKLMDSMLLRDVDNQYEDLNKDIDIEGLERLYVDIVKEDKLSTPFLKENELSIHTAESLLYKLQDNNKGIVIFLQGGEPMRHTKFEEILKLFSRNKKNRLIIYTNGVYLKESNKSIIKEYVNGVMLTIAHSDKRKNDIIMGVGHFDKYKEAVEYYKTCGVSVYMNVIPMKENIDSLVSLQQLAYDLKMKGIYIQNPMIYLKREGKQTLSSDFRKKYEAIKSELIKINSFMNSWKNNRIKDIDSYFFLMLDEERCFNNFKNLKYRPHCGIGLNELSIDEKGCLYPCHLLKNEEFKMENIEAYFKMKEHFERKSISNEKCNNCSVWLICLGGCRAETYFKTGHLDSLSDSCDEREKNIKQRLNRMAEV